MLARTLDRNVFVVSAVTLSLAALVSWADPPFAEGGAHFGVDPDPTKVTCGPDESGTVEAMLQGVTEQGVAELSAPPEEGPQPVSCANGNATAMGTAAMIVLGAYSTRDGKAQKRRKRE